MTRVKNRICTLVDAIRKAREQDFSSSIEIPDGNDDLDLLSDEIRQLVNAIQEQVAGRKAAEDARREYEDKYRRLRANIPGMVYTFAQHPDGSYSFPYVNEASRQLFDVSPEDLMADERLVSGLMHRDDRQRFASSVKRSAQTLQPWREVLRHVVNGEVRWYDCISRPELQPNGDILWDGIILEITDRKRVEEALQSSNDLLRAVIEAAPTAIIGLDLDGNVRDVWNPAAEKMLGWSADEVMGRPLPSVPVENQDEFRQFRDWIRSGKTMDGVEVSRRRRDGSLIDYSIYASPLYDSDGAVAGNIAVLVDISERKRSEEALRASENRFRMIVETAEEGIWQVDREWRTTYVNRRMEAMLGCEPGSMLGQRIHEFMDDEGRRAVAQYTADREAGRHETHDFRFVRRDGSPLDALVSATPLFNEHGEFVGSFAMVTDITERKRNENELRLSKFIIDKASLGIFQGGGDGRIVSINEHWAQKLGYTNEELCGLTFFDIDPTLTRDRWREHRKILTATGYNTFESVHRRKDGTTFPVEITVNYLQFQGREFSCSFARDITTRKAKDQALRQANLIVENSPAILFRWRAEHGWPVEMVSGNVAQFGYAPEEFISGGIPFSSIIFPEDQERVAAEVLAYAEAGADKFLQEYRIVTKDGDVLWIDDRTTVERDADGEISHYQGIVMDITDRKRTESVIAARMRLIQFAETHTADELLEATLNELEELTDSCIGFYHFLEADQQTLRLQNWSTRTRKEFCTTPGKGLHYDVSAAGVWVDCIHQRRPVIHNDYASLSHRKGLPPGHPPVIRELVVPVFRGDSIMAVLGVGNKPRNYTSNDMEIVSLLADLSWGIVERKRAEEALRISEQNYRDIVEHAPFGICHSTREGKMLSTNPALARILKYDSVAELLETVKRASIQEVLFAEPLQRYMLMDFVCGGHAWHTFENRYRCKDGSIITCNVHSRRIFDVEGNEIGFENFLENVTDRVQAEKDLRESEEKFRVLAETSPAGITLYQAERIVYANNSTARMFGYSVEELLGKAFWECAHEEFFEMVRARGLARLRGEKVPSQYECRFVTKNGMPFWAIISVGYVQYRGNPAGIVSIIDISETKRAEEQLKTSLAEKEILLKEVHHRVKNNLQIISSLLDLQSDYIHDGDPRRYITESQDRIRSMALVHEQLYKSKDLSLIDFAHYVNDLVAHLSHSFLGIYNNIATEVDIREIKLGIDEAIPCGLIINELVSNALKHAFPDRRTGTVRICGAMDDEGYVNLTVSDNGIGFPRGFDLSASESLGLQIVSLLTEQLYGAIDFQGDDGVTVALRFKSKTV